MRIRQKLLPLALLASCLAAPDARSAWAPDGNRVSFSAGSVEQMAAVSNGAGGVFVAWVDRDYLRNPSGHVFLQSLDADGNVVAGWSGGGLPLTNFLAGGSELSLVADGLGGAYITWLEGTGSSAPNLMLQRIGADGARAAGWPEGGLAIATSAGTAARLSADGVGGIFVGWTRFEGATLSSRQRVIRVLGNATIAPGWPTDGIDFGESPGPDPLALAPNGAASALVAWNEFQLQNFKSRLRVHHLMPDGTFDPAWPAGGTVLSERSGYYMNVSLVPDRGGAYASWAVGPQICPSFDACPDCYCRSDQIVSHVDAQGSGSGWPIEGLRLGDFGRISAAPEGGLVAITVRPATAAEIAGLRLPYFYFSGAFVTRLEPNGSVSPGWTHRGIVSTEARWPNQGDAVSDGHGGAFAAWIDSRTRESVIYGTRLAADGAIAPGWPEWGSLVAPAAAYPSSPVLVASGEGAIVLWLDSRTRTAQVWADRMVAGPPALPAVLDVVPGGLAGFGIRRVWPNPSRQGFAVTLELPVGAPATLEIYDLAGRVVGREWFEFQGPARGTVSLNRDRVLEPGVYWLRLRQGPRVASKRIIAIQ